jgi:hypothetical protein
MTAIPNFADPADEDGEEDAEDDEDDAEAEEDPDGEDEPDGAGEGLALQPAKSAASKTAVHINTDSFFILYDHSFHKSIRWMLLGNCAVSGSAGLLAGRPEWHKTQFERFIFQTLLFFYWYGGAGCPEKQRRQTVLLLR